MKSCFPWLCRTVLSSGYRTKSDFYIHLLSVARGSPSVFGCSPATTAGFCVHWSKMRQPFGWFSSIQAWFHGFPALENLTFQDLYALCTLTVAVQCRILKSQYYRDQLMSSIKLMWLVSSLLVHLSSSLDLGLVRGILKPHYVRNVGGITDHQILGYSPEIHNRYTQLC